MEGGREMKVGDVVVFAHGLGPRMTIETVPPVVDAGCVAYASVMWFDKVDRLHRDQIDSAQLQVLFSCG
jgi:uncharacterized protein YodC (DUF2158 family)